MNQLQKHIADSLERFYKKYGHIQAVKDEMSGNSYSPISDFFQAEMLQLLSIAKGEVENHPNTFGIVDKDGKGGAILVEDVLGTLTITEK